MDKTQFIALVQKTYDNLDRFFRLLRARGLTGFIRLEAALAPPKRSQIGEQKSYLFLCPLHVSLFLGVT